MQNKKIIICAILSLIFLPSLVNADVVINEIMYNPEGTDTKREWIEIKNVGNIDFLIEDLKFLESDVKHKLTVVQGNTYLEQGEIAIILTDLPAFLTDYPNFTGTAIDTSFSLTNTGEPLAILDKDDQVLDDVEYSDSLGANGDGNSLQLVDDVFISALPTPGVENNTEPSTNNDDNNATTTVNFDINISSHSEVANLIDVPYISNLKISAGRERLVTINSPISFVATFDHSRGTNYWWSFGDNNTDKGLEVENTYKYEGIYNVVLTAISKKDQAVSRTKVRVVRPILKLVLENNSYKLTNESPFEVNLGGYYLEFGNLKEKIVKDTILDPNQSLYFEIQATTSPKLFYPNNNEYVYPEDTNSL